MVRDGDRCAYEGGIFSAVTTSLHHTHSWKFGKHPPLSAHTHAHMHDAHFHEMGEVAMVIAYESPDARALIFQQTLRNEKILKIDEEDWMDVWALL